MTEETIKRFCSYSREDAQFVLKLAKDLREAGASLWLDQLDILPGQRWDDAVQSALVSCQGMVAVLSPSSVASQNFMDEVAYALREGKQIIPVLYQECDTPFRLQRLQHVSFLRDYDKGLAELLRALDREVPPPPPPDSRLKWIAVALGFALVMSGSGYWYWKTPPRTAVEPPAEAADVVVNEAPKERIDEGGGVRAKKASFIEDMRQACDGGSPEACKEVADDYKSKVDYVRAAEYYEKACSNSVGGFFGYGYGCVEAATIYHEGRRGVTKDDARAATLLQRACDKSFGSCSVAQYYAKMESLKGRPLPVPVQKYRQLAP